MKYFSYKNFYRQLFFCGLMQLLLSCTSNNQEVYKDIELIDPVYPEKAKRQHELIIHKDKDGHPCGYSMSLVNSVCLDNKCKLVEVTMYWDDAGNYSHLKYPENKPLTKVEHDPFTEEDYLRLDQILKDKKSMLQKHSLAYLAKEPDELKNKKEADDFTSFLAPEEGGDEDIDGESKATPAAVKEAVVKDAAWTTWVLWNYANTEIVPILQAETEAHCDPAYIQKTLSSKDWLKIEFMINYLQRKKIYSGAYKNIITKDLEKANIEQIELALDYLKKASKDENSYFKCLIKTLPEQGNYNAALIIDQLAQEENLNEEVLLSLTVTLKQLKYYAIHLSLRTIENKELFSERIEANLLELLDAQNFFIARRAYFFLKEQKLTSNSELKLAAFYKKHEDRL
ncbi:MAG: hypothetical protein MK132_21010 [Lentisphaerales bacterium]|nr:hypothetical protein [Lentisphaerales bacterium]